MKDKKGIVSSSEWMFVFWRGKKLETTKIIFKGTLTAEDAIQYWESTFHTKQLETLYPTEEE